MEKQSETDHAAIAARLTKSAAACTKVRWKKPHHFRRVSENTPPFQCSLTLPINVAWRRGNVKKEVIGVLCPYCGSGLAVPSEEGD